MMLLVALLGEALADTITLESGATLEGTLTHYELHGKCNVHVDQGGLAGADVVLPCDRVIRMERVAVVQSGPTTLDGSVIVVPDEQAPVEEITGPLLELAPAMMVAEEFSDADAGVEPEAAPGEPMPPAPAPEEPVPVAAVSPQEPVAAVPPEEPAAASPEEPAPAAEPEANAEPAPEEKAEAPPEKKGPLAGFTWPKIRLD